MNASPTHHKNNIEDLKALAALMDSKFKGPFGFKFGLDGIIGLIPGIGDFLTNLISIYIMARVSVMGYPPSIILRMGLNVLFENIVDAVPFFGNIFDFFWKANTRNLQLIQEFEVDPKATSLKSMALNVLVIGTVLFVLIGAVVLSAFVAYIVLAWIFSL